MKNKSTLLFIGFLTLLVLVTGYNYFKQPFYDSDFFAQAPVEEPEVTPVPTENPKLTYTQSLSTADKISQIMMYPVSVEAGDAEHIWIAKNKPGFVLLFGKEVTATDAAKTVEEVHDFYEKDDLSPIVAVDHEGGTVQRLSGEGFSPLPPWKEVCEAGFDPSELYAASAEELASTGINIVFAPVLDIAENHPTLGSRVCASSDELKIVSPSYIESFSAQGIMPVLKHFPGIGSTTKDIHTSFDIVELTQEDTDVFKYLLDTYPNIGLMVTHVGIKDVINAPCSLSDICIGKIPVQYPDALIFSDALEMKSARYDSESGELRSLTDVSLDAVKAGNTVLVYGEGITTEEFTEIHDALSAEYEHSAAFKEKVDASVEKILNLKKIPGMEE